MRRVLGALACAAMIGSGCVLVAGTASAAPEKTQGVTPDTIAVGISYIDLAAINKAVGLNIDQGSYPDAYNALIGAINAKGGINGRKIALKYSTVNPVVPSSGATSCTQLVQDDHVFVVISPYFPLCFVQNGVPTINGSTNVLPKPGSAVNFTTQAPDPVYDPYQLKILANHGVFKNKKVGVVGTEQDAPEVKIVDAALAKDHVKVVQTAVSSVPLSDTVAADQEAAITNQRLEAAGVDEVVAVGAASDGWPKELNDLQSSYNPPWVATNAGDLAGYVGQKGSNPLYLKGVVTTTPTPTSVDVGKQPAIRQCVNTIKKAYPNDVIATPQNHASLNSATTWVAPQGACANVAILSDILKAAGRNLTVSSLTRGGYSLRNVVIPGQLGPVSFGPNQPYTIGPIFIQHFDPASNQLVNVGRPLSQ